MTLFTRLHALVLGLLLLNGSTVPAQSASGSGPGDSARPPGSQADQSVPGLSGTAVLKGVVDCPSSAQPDYGICVNAAGTAAQVNVLDGRYATGTVLQPQPGQVLHFGVGIYTLPQIIVADSSSAYRPSNVIEGRGEGQTILQQNSTAQGPVIINRSFRLLTGTNSFYGAGFLRLMSLTLNAGAASRDCAVKIYGYAMVFRDLSIQHGGTCNRYTEWAYDLSKSPPLTFNQSGEFDHVTEFDAKANGVEYYGPLDSHEKFGSSYKNGGWAYYITQGFHVSYLQAIESDQAKPGSTGAIYVNGLGAGRLPAGLDGDDVFADGYSGTMIFYGPNSAPLKLSHSNVSGGGPNGLRSDGLDLEGGFGNSFTGEIESTSGTAVKINGGNLTGSFYMSGNVGYWFDFLKEPIPDSFTAMGGDALGTSFNHMPSPADSLVLLNLPPFGPHRDRTYVSGPQCTVAEGRRVCFPSAPGTLAALVSAGANTVLPVNDPSGAAQAKVAFGSRGNAKFECGKQSDGTFYCYDVEKGKNFLTVDANGTVAIGEGIENSTLYTGNGDMQVRGAPNFSALKATTGTRFLCIDTKGKVTSSAKPCSGT